ncbi:MAG TPA: 30S ribosomal protein S6 [Myxococcales bacterium]|nr:30S ribosomal protein S6 [Myxococcales bacterium]HIK85590.1 30S ribosomal protein S6 [Myxococcales bacterium]
MSGDRLGRSKANVRTNKRSGHLLETRAPGCRKRHLTGRKALREYETTFIVQPEISDEGGQVILSKLDGVLESSGATRLMCEDHGKRKLAYEVRKFSKGHYYTLMFLDEGKVVADLERTLRLEESVLRFLTILADGDVADVDARKASASEAEVEQTKRAEERAAREAEEAATRRAAEESERETALKAAEEAKAASAAAEAEASAEGVSPAEGSGVAVDPKSGETVVAEAAKETEAAETDGAAAEKTEKAETDKSEGEEKS